MEKTVYENDLCFDCRRCKKEVKYFRGFFSEDSYEYMEKMIQYQICWVCSHSLCFFCKSTFEVVSCACNKLTCRSCGSKCKGCKSNVCRDCDTKFRCNECGSNVMLCKTCTESCYKCKKVRFCRACAIFNMTEIVDKRQVRQICDKCSKKTASD